MTDQNQWAEVAKRIIAEKYPSWEVVATEFSNQDAQKAVQVPTALFQTYPDLDAVIAPDANALPGTAQAAENLGIAGNVIITGFSTPNTMRQYVKSGTVEQFGLWDVVVQGKLSVFIANELVQGKTFKVGDKIEVPGIGTVEISPNSVQGYDLRGGQQRHHPAAGADRLHGGEHRQLRLLIDPSLPPRPTAAAAQRSAVRSLAAAHLVGAAMEGPGCPAWQPAGHSRQRARPAQRGGLRAEIARAAPGRRPAATFPRPRLSILSLPPRVAPP